MGSIESILTDISKSTERLDETFQLWTLGDDDDDDYDATISIDEKNTVNEECSTVFINDLNTSESGFIDEQILNSTSHSMPESVQSSQPNIDLSPSKSSLNSFSSCSSFTNQSAEDDSSCQFDSPGSCITPASRHFWHLRWNRVVVRQLTTFSVPCVGQLSPKSGFCLGLNGEIVIADTYRHRICTYDASGALNREFGSAGTGPGKLWNPTKVAFIRDYTASNAERSSRFVVCDRNGKRPRIQIFKYSGKLIREITMEPDYTVEGIAITSAGQIALVNSCPPDIHVTIFAQSGARLVWFDVSYHVKEPSDLAVSGEMLCICDLQGHCVVILSQTGDFIRKIGSEFITPSPTGVHVSDAGDLYISYMKNHKLMLAVFDDYGYLLGEFKTEPSSVNHSTGLKMNHMADVITLDYLHSQAVILKNTFLCNYKSLRSLSPT